MPYVNKYKESDELSDLEEDEAASFLFDMVDDLLEGNGEEQPSSAPGNPSGLPSDNFGKNFPSSSNIKERLHSAPFSSREEDMTRFIHDAFHEKLPEFLEYHRKGYNRLGLDAGALRQMADMLQQLSPEDMTPGLQEVKSEAEKYLQNLTTLALPAKPSPVLKDALNVANKMTATICVTLDALSLAGRIGGKDWGEKVDEEVSKQLDALAGEAITRLNENSALPVSSEHYTQKKNALMGLMFSSSFELAAENDKFRKFKKSLLAEERVTRNNLAAWIESTAERILSGTEDVIDSAPDEPVAMRVGLSINSMNEVLEHAANMLRRIAADLRPVQEILPVDDKSLIDEASDFIQKIPVKSWEKIKGIYHKGRYLDVAGRKVLWGAHYTLDGRYGVRTDRGKSAVKSTGLLLLDELHQAEFWLRRFPTAAWELEESVEQYESVITQTAFSDREPVLSVLLDEKLKEEAARWEDQKRQSEAKLSELVASATRLTPETWVDSFRRTISDAYEQKEINPEEREWLLIFRDDMKDIVKRFSDIVDEIGGATGLALHGHTGGEVLRKKISRWLRELDMLKGLVRKDVTKFTGENVEYYSRRGMLARGMAQWGEELKQVYLQDTQPEDQQAVAAEFDERLIKIIHYNAGYFVKENSHTEKVFLERLKLELKHVAQHTTTFPTTPEEILAGTRSLPDDLKHWAQKKLTSGLIDAVIRRGVDNFTSPLSLPGRILWSIVTNGYSLYQGMKEINRGIKFGEGPATRVKERYIKNLLYKATIRVALTLSPATALGLAGLGSLARLLTEDNYLKKFVVETLNDLPEDMLWRGIYSAGYAIYDKVVWGNAQREAAENEEWVKTNCPTEIEPKSGPQFKIEGDPQFRFAIRAHLEELQKHEAGRRLLAQLKGQVIEIKPPYDDDFQRPGPDGERYSGSRIVDNAIYIDPYNNAYGQGLLTSPGVLHNANSSIVLFHQLKHIQVGDAGHQNSEGPELYGLDERDYRQEFYESQFLQYIKSQQAERGEDFEKEYKTNYPTNLKIENGPEINLRGKPEFRAVVHHHLVELQKHPTGRALLAKMKSETIEIRPPHKDDLLQADPDGTPYYASRSVGNTIHFDPYNSFYGRGQGDNTPAYRHLDPSIVLFHEILHIVTDEAGHANANRVSSVPDRLNENDYRGELYSSRQQEVIDREWGQTENNMEVAGYENSAKKLSREKRNAPDSSDVKGELSDAEIEKIVQYVTKNTPKGKGTSNRADLDMLKWCLGGENRYIISEPPRHPPAIQDGDIVEEDGRIVTDATLPQKGQRWLYLDGRYWPLLVIKDNYIAVGGYEDLIPIQLESGSSKPIVKMRGNNFYDDKFYVSQVLKIDIADNEIKEKIVSFAKVILEKNPHPDFYEFTRALQLVIVLHTIKLNFMGREEEVERYKAAEIKVAKIFGLNFNAFNIAEQVRFLVMSSDYADNDKNMTLLNSILSVRTLQGYHFSPSHSADLVIQEGDVLQGDKIVTDFSSPQNEARWIYLSGTYWPLVTLSNKKQAIAIGDDYIYITRIPGHPAKWILDTPELYAYELYAGEFTDDMNFKYSEVLDPGLYDFKKTHGVEFSATSEQHSHDVYYSIPDDDNYTEDAAIEYLTDIHDLDSQHYHKLEEISAAEVDAEDQRIAAIALTEESRTVITRTYFFYSAPPLQRAIDDKVKKASSDTYKAHRAKENAKYATENYVAKSQRDAALRYEMQKSAQDIKAPLQKQGDYDRNISELKEKINNKSPSKGKLLSGDKAKELALLKFKLYYTIWLRKIHNDAAEGRTGGSSERQYGDLSGGEKSDVYFDAMKYVLFKIENDPSIPQLARINAHDARMGYERVTHVDINGHKLLNCFFIPDGIGSKTGVLIDLDSPEEYCYVNYHRDIPIQLRDRFSVISTRNSLLSTNAYDSFDKMIAANNGLIKGAPDFAKSEFQKKWAFEKVFNSSESARTDIRSLSEELSRGFDSNGEFIDYLKNNPEAFLYHRSLTHHSENTNVRRLGTAGTSVDDSKFKVTKKLFTWDHANKSSFKTKFLRGVAHPGETSAEAIQERISINQGDSEEQAAAKIVRAKKIGAWVDTALSFSSNFVPYGAILSLVQSAADITADLSEGIIPDELAVASFIISVIPGSRVVKFIGKYSKAGMAIAKFGIIVSGRTVEAAGLCRSILLAKQTGDPLHIVQACIAAGFSAKDAATTSTKINETVIKENEDYLPPENYIRPTHVHDPKGSKKTGITAHEPESRSGHHIDDSVSGHASKFGKNLNDSDSGNSSDSRSIHHSDDLSSSASQTSGSYLNYTTEKKAIFLDNDRIKARNKLDRAIFFGDKTSIKQHQDQLALVEGQIRENNQRLVSQSKAGLSNGEAKSTASATSSVNSKDPFMIHETEFIARNKNDSLEISDDGGHTWTKTEDSSLSTRIRQRTDGELQRLASDTDLPKNLGRGFSERGETFTYGGNSIQGRIWRGYFEISQDGGATWKKGSVLHKLAWRLGAEESLNSKTLDKNIDNASKKDKYFSSMCYTNAFNVARQAQVISEAQLHWLNKVAKADVNKQIIGSISYRNAFGLQGRETFSTFESANINESGFMHVGMHDKDGVVSFDHVVYVHVNDSGISLYQANSFDFAPALSGNDPLTQNNLGPNASKAHFKHVMDAQKINNFDDYFKKVEKDGSQAIFTFTPASEVRANYDVVENSAQRKAVQIDRESLLSESAKRKFSSVEQGAVEETTSTLKSKLGAEYNQQTTNPQENRLNEVRKVMELLPENGYENIRVLELGIWPNGEKGTVATNHYVVLATKDGVDIVVDLTAGQFLNQYGFSEPLITTQQNWVATWQGVMKKHPRTLVKSAVISGSLDNSLFSGTSPYVYSHEFVLDGNLITRPAWYNNESGIRESEFKAGTHGPVKNIQSVSPDVENAAQVANNRYNSLQNEFIRLEKNKLYAQYNYQRTALSPMADETLLKVCRETIDDLNMQIDNNQQRMNFWSQRLDDLHSDPSIPPHWYEKLQRRDASRSVSEVLLADENAALDTTEINVGHNLVTTNHVDFFPDDEDHVSTSRTQEIDGHITRSVNVYEWRGMSDSKVNVGDYYIFHNPLDNALDYFRVTQKPVTFLPIDRSSSQWWTYVGSYPDVDESLLVHYWNSKDQFAKKGWVYSDGVSKLRFKLKGDAPFGDLPVKAEDNKWWQYVGTDS